jgi:hypothetical protein
MSTSPLRVTAHPAIDGDGEPSVSPPKDGPSVPVGLPHRLPPRRPLPSQRTPSDPGDGIFPVRLFDRPNSVIVYGPSRPLVNLLLFALARSVNPDFAWVDIGSPKQERTPCDPVRLGWVPEDRLWLVNLPELVEPDTRSARLPLFEMIRSDESPEVLTHVTEFLRLPDISQRILSDRPSSDQPGVVAVANIHRVAAVFSSDRVPRILNLHREAGFSVLAGYAGLAGSGRDHFDYVFRVQGEDEGFLDWKKNQLVCERGISSGPLGGLRPVRLEEIPLVAEVVARARPHPWPNPPTRGS